MPCPLYLCCSVADSTIDVEIAISNIVAIDVNRLPVCKGDAGGSQGVSGLLFRGYSAEKTSIIGNGAK